MSRSERFATEIVSAISRGDIYLAETISSDTSSRLIAGASSPGAGIPVVIWHPRSRRGERKMEVFSIKENPLRQLHDFRPL